MIDPFRIPYAIALALALAACARGPASPAGAPSQVEVTGAWAQPSGAAGTSAAVYMTIKARCEGADLLQGVAAPAGQEGSLHQSSAVDGALQMKALASVAVPCGATTALKPMAQHVMLTGLKPLRVGDQLPLTLRFRDAGEVPVTAEVTTAARLEDVDPMHMHTGKKGGEHDMGNMHH